MKPKWSYAVPSRPGRYWWQSASSDRAFEVKLLVNAGSMVLIDPFDGEITLLPGSKHGRWCKIEFPDQADPWEST